MFVSLRTICLPKSRKSEKKRALVSRDAEDRAAMDSDTAMRRSGMHTSEERSTEVVPQSDYDPVSDIPGCYLLVPDSSTARPNHMSTDSDQTLVTDMLQCDSVNSAPPRTMSLGILPTPPPDIRVETLWEQLQQQSEQLEKARLILNLYRKREDYLTKTLSAKETSLHTVAEFTASKIHDMTQSNKLLEEAWRSEKQAMMQLTTQLANERKRAEKAESELETAMKTLISETQEKNTLRQQLVEERESTKITVETLKTERDTMKTSLTTELQTLRTQVASDKILRQADKKYAELQRKRLNMLLDSARKRIPGELAKKQIEVDTAVGAPVAVLRVGKWADDDLTNLTPSMLKHLKQVVEQFSKTRMVKKIEYLMNETLYKRYDTARRILEDGGRNGNEILAYHGTKQQNIDAYCLVYLIIMLESSKMAFSLAESVAIKWRMGSVMSGPSC